MATDVSLTRRRLMGAGALGLGAAVTGRPAFTRPMATDDLASLALRTMCTLTPSATEGPYYVNQRLLRTDITEGKPGLQLYLFYQVVHAADCSPIASATVDVWHADAVGVYSGFAAQGTAGQTFLRGVQVTGANGLAGFVTVYPGYYPGRTTHIHVKVHLQSQTVLTTQTYFPDPVTDIVYQVLPPYSARAARATRNQNDGIFTPETVKTVLLNPDGSLSLVAGLIIGVA